MRMVVLSDACPGDVLAADVVGPDNLLLCSKGVTLIALLETGDP